MIGHCCNSCNNLSLNNTLKRDAAMSDPFLLSHAVGPLQFSISGPLSPVSIRDQMIRGKMFADRAIEQHLISPARPLLVVGAGAGGVTAAIQAAQQNIPTTIIEASSQAFGRQRNCRSRWIDPTQYDWPVSHWRRSIYPWTPPPMPLPWGAQLSNVIGALWRHQLALAQRAPSPLKVEYATIIKAKNFRPSIGDLEVILSTKSSPAYYGAALFAVGFGTEKTLLGEYQSYRFWETDDFEAPFLGLAAPTRSPKWSVLICGAGDGGLQDFLRIVTGHRSAADILKQIPTSAIESLVAELQSAEDQAQRAWKWCGTLHDHAVFQQLFGVYKKAADSLLSDPSFRTQIWSVLKRLTARASHLDVTLTYPCTHFSKCYGLNHFLVLVILAYAARNGLSIRALPNEVALSVEGLTHLCTKSPAKCHGEDHEVEFQTAACGQGLSNRSNGHKETYDVVVLRIGVLPPRPFAGTMPMFLARQLLPYHASQ